jgi:hypothetical protein
VPKQFDEQLEALVTYIGQKGWTITSLDVSELHADLAQQRGDRQKDLDLVRQAGEFRQAFLAGQTERYRRFMRALEVLRAAHRDDPEVQKALEQFKRVSRRVAAPPAQTAAPKAA